MNISNKLMFLPLFCIEFAIVVLGIIGAFYSCNIGFFLASLITYNIILFPSLCAAFFLIFFYNKLNYKLFVCASVLQAYSLVLLFLTKYFDDHELWNNVVWSIYLFISFFLIAILFKRKKINIFAILIILLFNFIQCLIFLMAPL